MFCELGTTPKEGSNIEILLNCLFFPGQCVLFLSRNMWWDGMNKAEDS